MKILPRIPNCLTLFSQTYTSHDQVPAPADAGEVESQVTNRRNNSLGIGRQQVLKIRIHRFHMKKIILGLLKGLD